MSAVPKIFIFSAHLKGNSPQEDRRVNVLVAAALTQRGIDFKELEGCYKGEKETSFLVVDDGTPKTQIAVEALCKEFKQESYFVRADTGRCYLVFMDDRLPSQELGLLREVPKALAVRNESYTYDPSSDVYYVTEKA